MEIPHINIKREGSTWNGWCVHYAGFSKPGASLEKVTHCEAGVEYESVKSDVKFTLSYDSEPTKYTHSTAHPCFKREYHLTNGCDKCRFPTPEEIKAHEDEATSDIKKMVTARKAIMDDLKDRWKAGERELVLPATDMHRFYCKTEHYFCGQGKMECPVCNSGELRYSRSTYNGHVHARCSTEGCVAWME